MKSRVLSVVLATSAVCLTALALWYWKGASSHPHTTQDLSPIQEMTAAPDRAPAATPPPPPAPTTTTEPSLPPLFGRQGSDNLASCFTTALRGADWPLLERLVQHEAISPGLFAQARDWASRYAVGELIPVGTYLKDGHSFTRFRITSSSDDPDATDLLIDLTREADLGRMWTVVQLTEVPKTQSNGSHATLDTMQVVEGFINALRDGDMDAARAFVISERVQDVTLAGLCMVFEESAFRLRPKNPMRTSFQNKRRAAYLVYLVGDEPPPVTSVPVDMPSPQKPQPMRAQVGVEMRKDGSGAWRIHEVSLDSLLAAYEGMAGDEGGHYFPIVKSPQGGDSLALFFGFDEDALTPRSVRQLQIVARLLKSNGQQVDISGHTDDQGTEHYNDALSLRRAKAVQKVLLDAGVLPSQVSTKGMGMHQPRRSYDAANTVELERHRAENRRAEIYLDFSPAPAVAP